MDRTSNLQILKDSIHFENFASTSEKSEILASTKSNLKSGALDNLIAQNEDLTTRFRVLLRRLSVLEDENLRYVTENKEFKTQLNSVSDQIAIFKDKESIWRQRTLAAEEAMDMSQAIVRKKEIEFAQMRTQDWQEKEQLKKHIEKIDKQRLNLIRYRARIRLYLRPFIDRLKLSIFDLNKTKSQQKNQIEFLNIQVQKISDHNKNLIIQHRDESKKLEESKLSIVTQFEKHQDDLKNDVKGLKELNAELTIRSSKLDKSLERQDYLENRVIEFERIVAELKQKYNDETENLQKQFFYWRNHAQSLEVQSQSLSERFNETQQSLNINRELTHRLQEQLEAIRHLWTDSSQETTRLRNCNDALEKLNSELCVKLNEARNQNSIRTEQ
jgi:chromosome segregation ATPase